MSRIPVGSRHYNLRYRGNSVKFPSNGSCPTDKCSNCLTLLRENDSLRRQISFLYKQLSESDSALKVPLSDGSLIPVLPQVPDHCEQSINVPLSNRSSSHLVSELTQELSKLAEDSEHSAEIINLENPKHSVNGDNDVTNSINSYQDLSRGVFQFVDTAKLDIETHYTHKFENRAVAYYGDFPYAYNGGFHNTRPVADNPYLKSILERLRSQFPKLKFNSAMITKYRNGQQGIPFHSDDERSISPGSMISTISLGATRVLSFRSKLRAHIADLTLSHGDIMNMTRQSQTSFEHSLIQDKSETMRISITLRLIDGSATLSTLSDVSSQVKNTEPSAPKTRSIEHSGKSLCVYISSSMFSKLEGEKLSSKHHEAHVFSYPGATANAINERFQSDVRKDTLNTNNVKSIVLMCGTNLPFSDKSA